ncbi:maleylpyruvate isomerase family mycothiol-dependent enzyme [Flexivirga sp. B27]
MAVSLEFDECVNALYTAAERLREDTVDAPEDALVPTCPGWSTRQLLAHTGMVHRWATANVRGDRHALDSTAETDAAEEEGMLADDPGAWLLAGAGDLVQALQEAPDDLERPFFLNDAPPAKLAWARRQCHETTIHAFDGLTARLGGIPPAVAADIDPAIAADGVDELLQGFATRPDETLRTSSRPAVTVVVEAPDVQRAWTLQLSGEPMACEEGAAVPHPDAKLTGTATQLYLGLWNRGDEIAQDGIDVLSFWREHLRVEW